MVTKADPQGEAGPGEAPPSDDGLVDKIREVVSETLDGLFGSGKADVVEAGGEAKPDPLDKPLTMRDLEAFSAKQMREQQAKVKPPPKAKPEASGEPKPAEPAKPPEGEEQPPQKGGKPGWRERFWG